MKNKFTKLLLIFAILVFSAIKVEAQTQFELLVLPTDIFSVCDNYFCFPEVSNIIAEDVISDLKTKNNINVKTLNEVRLTLNTN